LLIVDGFVKNTEIAHNLGYFSNEKVMNFDKKCVELILDDFFTNSSGHPGSWEGRHLSRVSCN
jgi:hypothetical protein